ncbi:hypothetical protein GCM10028805_22450 [Spirosoma harenae]
MAILRSEDFFPFDDFSGQIKGLESLLEGVGQSVLTMTGRIKSIYDASQNEIATLKAGLKGISEASDSADKKIAEHISLISQAGQRTEAFRQTQSNLTEAQRLNAQVVAELTAKFISLSERYNNLDRNAKDYAKQQRAILNETKVVSRAIDAQSKSLQVTKKAIDAAEGSFQHLEKQTKELRQTLKEMPNAFDLTTGAINRNNRAAMDLQAQIEKNSKALLAADRQMGLSQRNVGNYGSVLKDVTNDLIGFSSTSGAIVAVIAAVKNGIDIVQDMERYDASLKEASRDSLDFVRSQEFLFDLSGKLGLKYGDLAESYKNLKSATKDTNLEGRQTEKIFTAVTTAGAKLRLSSEAVDGTLKALVQMISKGKISAEELRQQLGEHLPSALRLMAESLGVSTSKLDKMMQQGELISTEVMPKFAAELEKAFGLKQGEKIDNLASSTTNLANEFSRLVKQFSDTTSIINFFKAITDGLGHSLGDIRRWLKDGSVLELFTFFGAGSLTRRNQFRKDKEDALVAFGGMDAKQRLQKIKELRDQELAAQKAGDIDTANERAAIAQALSKRHWQMVNSEYKDGQRKQKQKEIADLEKDENDKARFLKQSLKKRTAEILALEKQLDKDPKNELLAKKLELYQRLDAEQRATDKQIAERIKSQKGISAEKAQREADRKLSLAIGLNQKNTDVATSALDTSFQSGAISERDFIDQRLKIQQDGILKEQDLLRKAGKESTAEYKDTQVRLNNLAADYIKKRAEIEHKEYKDQLEATKSELGKIDAQVAESLTNRLADIQLAYDNEENVIKLAVAKRQMSQEEGERLITKARLKQINDSITAYNASYDTIEQLTKSNVDKRIAFLEDFKKQSVGNDIAIASAQNEINKLKEEQADRLAKNEKKRAKDVADAKVEANRKGHEQEVKDAEWAEQRKQMLIQKSLEAASAITDAYFTIRVNNTQAEIDNLQASKDRELQLVGDNEEARAKIEADFEQKSRELRRKQIEQQRAQAIFSIITNTAAAVIGSLAQIPAPAGLPFAILTGVMGAAQLAAVASAPIPQYKTGKRKSDSYEGPALAGEAGSELYVDREGYAQLFTKPTYFQTKKGDTVYTADQTARILSDMNRSDTIGRAIDDIGFNTSVVDRIRKGRVSEQAAIYQLALSGSPQLTESGIERAFGKALDDRPVNETHIDEHGIKRLLREGQNRMEYRERRYKHGR